MLNLSDFINIVIKGKEEYHCLISPSGIIVSVKPSNSYLNFKNIQEVYSEYGEQMEIKEIFVPEPPLVLDSDKFDNMIKKSHSLEYLAKKFELEAL